MHLNQADLWLGDELVWRAAIPQAEQGEPLRFEARIALRVRGERTLHAVARGGSGLDALLGRNDVEPLAFTNPIYLEGNR